MGSNLCTRVYETESFAEAVKRWAEDVASSRHEDGVSYSGAIGMLDEIPKLYATEYASVDEARAFIAEHHEKWERTPIAVTARADDPGARQDLERRRREANEAISRARRDALARASQDVVLLPCRVCGSRIQKVHLRIPSCPVCRDNYGLLSSEDESHIRELEAAYRRMDEESIAGNALCWVIGGQCPS